MKNGNQSSTYLEMMPGACGTSAVTRVLEGFEMCCGGSLWRRTWYSWDHFGLHIFRGWHSRSSEDFDPTPYVLSKVEVVSLHTCVVDGWIPWEMLVGTNYETRSLVIKKRHHSSAAIKVCSPRSDWEVSIAMKPSRKFEGWILERSSDAGNKGTWSPSWKTCQAAVDLNEQVWGAGCRVKYRIGCWKNPWMCKVTLIACIEGRPGRRVTASIRLPKNRAHDLIMCRRAEKPTFKAHHPGRYR